VTAWKRGGQLTLASGTKLTASAGRGSLKAKVSARGKRHLSAAEESALAPPPLVHTRKRGLR